MASVSPLQLDEAHFLKHYWQQRPLLIPNALPGFVSPLSPEELAGLACEPESESRIVGFREGVWSLQTGPFEDRDFQRDDLWTLLVQGVDAWLPEVAALRKAVSFLPRWRFDDVMVSYAVDGGSVGPHFDRYDVFLLQGSGERLWRLGDFCDDQTPRIEHEQLHLLESFATVEEYLLKPGDVLYVPPGMAHWGIAVGDCMTYSLGFRAPTLSQMLARFADEVLNGIDPNLLLEDRDSLLVSGRQGELTRAQLDNAREAVLNAMRVLDSGSWLAELITEPSHEEEFSEALLLPGPLMLVPQTQMVWIERSSSGSAKPADDACVEVFAAGESICVPQRLIGLLETLCAGDAIEPDSEDEELALLVNFLATMGVLINEE